MAINTATLMALEGNLVIGVKTTASFTLKDMVCLKIAINSGIYDKSYDMNNDGILDAADVDILRKKYFLRYFKHISKSLSLGDTS